MVNIQAEPQGRIDGRAQNPASNGIQVVGEGCETEPGGLKRNAAPAGGWVQQDGGGQARSRAFVTQPFPIFGAQNMLEGSGVAVRLTFEALA
jgi:hypothetical protein